MNGISFYLLYIRLCQEATEVNEISRELSVNIGRKLLLDNNIKKRLINFGKKYTSNRKYDYMDVEISTPPLPSKGYIKYILEESSFSKKEKNYIVCLFKIFIVYAIYIKKYKHNSDLECINDMKINNDILIIVHYCLQNHINKK